MRTPDALDRMPARDLLDRVLARDVLERLVAAGAAAQTMVPGVYAWGVTVAPAAWARGSSGLTQSASLVALAALGLGVVGEGRWGGRARVASLWGFVIGSAVVWSTAPSGLGPTRMDSLRGIAGMLGWALFAFASAAPALRTNAPEESSQAVPAPPAPPPARAVARAGAVGDVVYVVVGAFLAAMLQAIGWRVAGAERALLVRFVALAAGLTVIGAATEVALVRRGPRVLASPARRLRRALGALVALALLAIAGLLLLVSG